MGLERLDRAADDDGLGAAADLTIGVRVQDGGRMSSYLASHANVGVSLDVMTPNGSFHAGDGTAGTGRYAAFAAGSGITPVLSIAATALERHPGSRFQLYYGNTSRKIYLSSMTAGAQP